MSRRSVSAALEAKLLETLRTLVPGIHSVGLLETADAGKAKDEDMTSLQVRVYNFEQPHYSLGTFTVSVEIRLNVEQAESANGGLFLDAHEKIALWLERAMIGCCGCAELETEEAHVDGLQRDGDDKGFDDMLGAWYAVWNVTLAGCINNPGNDSSSSSESGASAPLPVSSSTND